MVLTSHGEQAEPGIASGGDGLCIRLIGHDKQNRFLRINGLVNAAEKCDWIRRKKKSKEKVKFKKCSIFATLLLSACHRRSRDPLGVALRLSPVESRPELDATPDVILRRRARCWSRR